MPTTVAPHDARHGRGASNLAEIPPAGWRDILWRTYSDLGSDHVLLVAAGVTFYTLLALVPALTALVSIYGIVADPTPGHVYESGALVVPEGPGLGVVPDVGRLEPAFERAA